MITHTQTGRLNVRTEVYRSLGTLRGAEVLLSEGVGTATEQMYLLVRFVVEVLGRLSDAEESHIRRPETWLSERLGESLHLWRHAPSHLHDWHTLFANSQKVLDWDPYREFANLLEMRHGENVFRRTAREVSRTPHGPSIGFVVAVAEEFRESRLPAAVRGFDPERGKGHEQAWFATVFRWFLLRRASADRSVREQLSLVGAFVSAPLQPDEILERLENHRVAQNLQEGLRTLDAKHADALRSYFGLDGRREHALHEIAVRYGVSHHTARWLVVDALTALSVHLGVQGVFSEEEFAFAQLVFAKGIPTNIAARQLKLGESAVRRSIRAKFHATLRKRTTLTERDPSIEDPSVVLSRGATKGLSQRTKVSKMEPERIRGGLRQLTEEPKIYSEGNQKFVTLAEGAVSLTEIRSFLAENEELCDELVETGVPLEWVFTHDGERVDVFPGTTELADEIEKIASREWSVAAFVRDECVRNSAEQKLPQLSERSATDEPVARIVETLEGLSVALLRTIDARLRQTRPPLCIWRGESTVYGRWDGGPPQFELPPFVLRQAMRFGEFHHDAAAVVASTVTALLASGELPLPGFDLEKPSNGLQILRPQASGAR
jgi:hypothetical protein